MKRTEEPAAEPLLQRASDELEAEERSFPSDPAAESRVLDRLLRELPARTARARPGVSLWLIAAAFLLASVGAAAVAQLRLHRAKPSPTSSLTTGAKARATPRAQEPVSAPLELAPAVETASSAFVIQAPAAAPVFDSAPGLLSAAGRARREGRSAEAITLLERLQARFPGSGEAHASDIALGTLQLKSGSAGAAHRHFERYLSHSPRGALAPDALWGLAQAASAEGHAAEAREHLNALLDRYPGSAYASAARAKLRAP